MIYYILYILYKIYVLKNVKNGIGPLPNIPTNQGSLHHVQIGKQMTKASLFL